MKLLHIVPLIMTCLLCFGCQTQPPSVSRPLTFRTVEAETLKPLSGVRAEQHDGESKRIVVGMSDKEGLIHVGYTERAHRFLGFRMEGYLPTYADPEGQTVRVSRMMIKNGEKFDATDVVTIKLDRWIIRTGSF